MFHRDGELGGHVEMGSLSRTAAYWVSTSPKESISFHPAFNLRWSHRLKMFLGHRHLGRHFSGAKKQCSWVRLGCQRRHCIGGCDRYRLQYGLRVHRQWRGMWSPSRQYHRHHNQEQGCLPTLHRYNLDWKSECYGKRDVNGWGVKEKEKNKKTYPANSTGA